MKVFSQLISEGHNETFALTTEEFDKYKEAIEKTKRSKEFLQLMWMVGQYPELFETEKIEDVLKGRFSCKTVPSNVMKDIYKIAKKVGDEVKLLPQLLSANQREAVIDRKIDPNDLTLDLETPKGREAIARRYAPLIEKLVNEFFKDGCPLTKEELRSAAMLGLAVAMNTYKNPDELAEFAKENKGGNTSFTSFAAYKIKFQILGDLEDYGRTVKFSNYNKQKWREEHGEDADLPSEFSIDNFHAFNQDGEPIPFDNFFGLDVAGDEKIESGTDARLKKEMYQKLFKRIESKFGMRDCVVLYKVWGINGHKKEKVKDIAKELNISSPAVTQICARIIKFVANDKYCKELANAFESLVNDYIVGKLVENFAEDRNTIIESFVYDDMYLLIESLGKWKDKAKFQKMVNSSTDPLNIDDALFIYNVLQGKVVLDAKIAKKNLPHLVKFLEGLYPDRSFKKMPVEDIIVEMNDLAQIAQDFNIQW